MIRVVVVGYGLAGRAFHCPLIRRQTRLELAGIVARDAHMRAQAAQTWGVEGLPSLQEALARPDVDLIVIATPHDTHADLVTQTLESGKNCVVDKVMALTTADADRMIAARERAGQMLSVFHNRRWDWDFATLKSVLASGQIGRPLLLESSVCRSSRPRTWRGRAASAGTLLHDWGAHLVDQALSLGLGPCQRLTAWLTPYPDPEIDSGGHGRIVMEFNGAIFQAETSRICRIDRPRWWVVGSAGGFVKFGVDPQEAALRDGDLNQAFERPGEAGLLRVEEAGAVVEHSVESIRASWDDYYANIAAHLLDGTRLAVTAEEAREVVRVLEAAETSSREHRVIEGPWGN